MFFKFLLSVLLLRTKLVFIPPPKKKYLLYHKASFFVKEYLEKGSYNILHTKFDEFNFFIFFKSLFKFKGVKLSTKYVLTYITYVQPTFIISSIDNQLSHYNLKKYFEKVIIISIQNGVRNFGYRGFEFDIYKDKEYLKSLKLSCDFFFVMSKKYEKVFSSFIKSKFINSGSIKSNMCPIGKNLNDNIAFISQYAAHRMNSAGDPYRYTDEITIKNALIFCKRENLRCSILLRTNKKGEKKFYQSILKDYIEYVDFIKTKSYQENFQVLDKFKLIVSVDSTLGYEMISRNKRTVLISCRDQFLEKVNDLRRLDFGNTYGEHHSNDGFFWINRFKKEDEIQKKIRDVYFTSEEKITTEYQKYKDALFYVDRNNIKLKKILNEKK